jgi:RNA polymerase sigma factor (sigma-70 family)
MAHTRAQVHNPSAAPPPLAPPPPAPAASPRAAAPDTRSAATLPALLAALRQPLRQLLRRLHISPQDGEDIVQDALYSLLCHWRQVANPAGYLFATVRRLAAIHLRRLAAERLVQVAYHALPNLATESPAARIERRRDVHRFLSRLPLHVRHIALLHYGAGLTYREIAAELGHSEPAIRQLVSRGLRRLQRDLQL